MHPDRKPDAVIVPANVFKGDLGLRVKAMDMLFSPVLGVEHVYVMAQGTGDAECNFICPKIDPPATLLFPKGHPLWKTQRYDWYRATLDKTNRKSPQLIVSDVPASAWNDHRGGFLVGWLKPDPFEGDEAVAAGIVAELATLSVKRLAATNPAQLDDPQFRADLVTKFGMTAAEVEALAAESKAKVAKVAKPAEPKG
jgi:hypothetical protein